ncbi:MAG: hypothetical protein IIW25_02040 [Bacteroidales bacterium]|nr:hypothetical protein [Bacteroidales bacterium]
METLKKIICKSFYALLALVMVSCGGEKRSVAIVVDQTTYGKIAAEVDAYVASVADENRIGVLVVDKWANPDSIKAVLFDMYQNNNLEGAVFIGDIPIPMVRDAQHMTTAFKMDQNRRMDWSSVPSDRFYDDFDLAFDFIKQDENKKLFFYYSLRPDCPQTIACDIYSARIKAPEGENKYQLVADYLKKAVAAKGEVKKMDKVLHFAGHGYNSESMNARIDEAVALTEHFQFLNNNQGKLDYIDFTFDKSIKKRLMAAVADTTLDLAILHHHGGDDAQYLNGSPYEADPAGWINLARNYFRGKVRDAKNPAETKARFKAKFDIPSSWMDDAFSADRILEDSLYAAGMDIMIPDLAGYSSGAQMVILDACFNGSFCNDDYLASHYIFNPGNTVVVKANSVNTLQDTWTTELIGLLNWGACAGNWAKGQMTLESHLFGDPTFTFAPQNTDPMGGNFDINTVMFEKKADAAYWKGILRNSAEDEMMCDMKSLAIKMLQLNGAITSEELVDIQKNSNSRIVRLAAFNANRKIGDKNLCKAIALGLEDTYELMQRLSAQYAVKNFASELIPVVAKTWMDPTTPGRVVFQLQGGIAGFDAQTLIDEMKRINEEKPYWAGEEAFGRIVRIVENGKKDMDAQIASIKDGSMSAKDMKNFAKYRRNRFEPQAVEPIIYMINNSTDQQIRKTAADALGWYEYSSVRENVLAECEKLYEVEKDEQVKAEFQKAINRLK